MAEGAISTLLAPFIQQLILDEFKLLSGVRDEIDLIRGEFKQMNAFLQVAGAHEYDDPQFEEWVKQVRDTAYDAGDILEQFMLRLGNSRGGRFSWFYKTYGFMKTITVRHQIASEVERIKSKLRGISESNQRYQHYKISTPQDINTTRYDPRRDDALHLRESELVGITKRKSELIKLLVDNKNHKLQVVSVCGTGGLGKTTLVKKVFDDVEIMKHFEAHAWITVSKSFQTKELLKGLIKQLFAELKEDVPGAVEQMDENELKTYITGFLESKRYVIVLDDVWTTNGWDALKYAFPVNNLRSRVIFTTRKLDVASSIGNVYELSLLTEEESWILFCKKAFQGESCPQGLEEITKAILKKCGGLPLAVVAIGGLLATKDQRIDEWNKTYRGLRAEFGKEGKLTDMDKVLSLSYFDLPWYLKLCFLYLSIFPEDHLIDPSLLIRLWIAEGFVQFKSGLTPEEVAGEYLTELSNRSLILVATREDDGSVKEYQIHDMWHELILSRSRKQDLVTTFGAQQSSLHKVRRLSIHNETGDWQDIKDRATHIRSVLMFGSRDSEFTTPIMDSLGNGERLVKVLHLGNSGLTTFPRQIGKLLHLKYLSLRDTRIKEVPKSIGDLQMLETLDLDNTEVRELPNEILKLRRLRHLLVSNGFKALKGIEKLSCLQELSLIDLNVSDSDAILRNLGKLTELREIGIIGLKSRDAKELCMSLEKLTELRSLSIYATDDGEIYDLEPLSSPPKYLQTLRIGVRMEKLPQWIPSLQNLTRLVLRFTKLKEDPLLQLQDLPNLTYLCLWDAYEGEALTFQAATFKKLTLLKLGWLKGLKRVSVMEGAMPRLKRLEFNSCRLMEELPSGIETLPCLTHLELAYMSDELISKLNRHDNSCKLIAHIPNVHIYCFRNGEFYNYKL